LAPPLFGVRFIAKQQEHGKPLASQRKNAEQSSRSLTSRSGCPMIPSGLWGILENAHRVCRAARRSGACWLGFGTKTRAVRKNR
jgi:hypothetical protein